VLVVECKEVNRSLEQAYLRVVSMNTEKES